ncbi:tryptophan 7-halogenase [Aestuariibacter halophilus]|uniref:Tryptophan 7-halogenase n=1 Tax=Fluctibacter halophilus TaxID=226011 RepID=A0ABS8GC16_9ALTE|nr:tryptophan halogenase family protein [Aestuariibacter halophilus]MCC2617304.1 tryptophan 7-halogenase [Aestuariibacter halophilus]
MNNSASLKHIVIAGGGTAGWMAAATLGNIFSASDTQITLIESSQIGTIGVGEATIPPFIAVIESLGIDLVDFIQHTQSSFKWGIQFVDWHTRGQSYFHPFGTLGQSIDGHDFFQCWLKSQTSDHPLPLMAHSKEAALAEHGAFFKPHEAANTPLASAQFALHVDASLVVKYLKRFAMAKGVRHIDAKIAQVKTHPSGDIAALQLDNGQQIEGDFFIDCTGFGGLLIEQTLASGYHDWRMFLPCNKAVTVPTAVSQPLNPFTIATARDAGWTWKIPLQHRTGNGYVFADDFCDDQQALDCLLSSVEEAPLDEPRFIPFRTGVRKQPWKANCLALGLAQGFLEPLESTAIHLVSKSLALFVRMFPSAGNNDILRNEFNRRVQQDYEEIRDFLILHYCETQRDDTDFWRWCQHDMPIPDSLQHKLAFFRHAGGLIPGVETLFQPTSWYAVFNGMGVQPQGYNPTLDALDAERLNLSLQRGAQGIAALAAQQPSHADFLRTYCPAHPPDTLTK